MQDLAVGRLRFAWGTRTYVMGILNITPDSFSGDGVMTGSEDWLEYAIDRGRQFFDEGADLIDVGGESTRPGAARVPAAEQIERVVPVIERLAAEGLGPISVDTTRAEVAGAALDAGAHIINDVWGLREDPGLGDVAAARGAPIIVMHNRSRSGAVSTDPRLGSTYLGAHYDDLLGDVARELVESVGFARDAGIPESHIIVDPGIGFGKTVSQNLELIDRIGELRALGYPVLVGPSRKSFIGHVLDSPPDERLGGTAASVAVAIARGVDIVRVHDVGDIVPIVRMTDALVRRRGR